MMRQKIVTEIRRLFMDGATPSQLMERIAREHKDDPRLHAIIMEYFREAFGVPLVRNVVPGDDYSPSSRHAHYNPDILPEIVRRMSDWNVESLEESWLNGASVCLLAEHTERLKTAHFEELDRVWDTLDDKEKLFIIRKVALKDYYWDVVKLLAMMAERLQQKIVELEDRLTKKPPSGEVLMASNSDLREK